MLKNFLRLGIFCFCFVLWSAHTQDTVREDLNKMTQELNAIRVDLLDLSKLTFHRIHNMKQQVKEISTHLQTLRMQTEKDLLVVQGMLDELGPAPTEGEIPEDAEMAHQRHLLELKVGFYQNRLKRIKALSARSQSLVTDISQARLALQVFRLKQRQSGLYELHGGKDRFSSVAQFFTLDAAKVFASLTKNIKTSKSIIFGLVYLILIGVGIFLRHVLKRRYSLKEIEGEISDWLKLKSALATFIANGVIPIAIAFMVVNYIEILQLFSQGQFAFLLSVYFLFSGLWIYLVFLKAALAPHHPGERYLNFSNELAHSLWVKLGWMGPLIAIALWFRGIEHEITLPIDFADIVRFVIQGVLCFVGLWLIFDASIWQSFKKVGYVISKIVRFIAATILIAVPVLLFIGYIALAEYLLINLLQSSLLIAAVFLVYQLIHSLIDHFIAQSNSLLTKLKSKTVQLIHYWMIGIVAIITWAFILIGLLFIWGIGSDIATSITLKIVYGFQIGNQQISILNIGLSILIFVALILVIKAIMRVLDKHVFPYTTMQKGLAEAVKTMIRYILFLIALFVSIRTLGIKLTSLAYIAGGLSVGVGLGLQPIIMNFISGIIMLIERPVRVGDTLEINNEMGVVTKISVRATQMRTFDRSLVMIPNSYLITNSVKNWTRENLIRRLTITVGVAYGSDTQKVADLLLEAAKENDHVLIDPGPTVVFESFGESALQFSLRAFIKDIGDTLTAKTALHLAIDQKFRSANITIAFPQRDVHIKQEMVHV